MRPLRTTIFVLLTGVLCLALPVSPSLAADFSGSDFSGDAYCNGCHSTLHAQWQPSMHAQAVSDQIYQKNLSLVLSDLGGPDNAEALATQAFCLKCHTPIGTMTGDIPPRSAIAISGVSCDFCHTVSGTTGVIGNASYVNTPGDVKRGPYVDSISPGHDTTLSTLHAQADFCGMCHDVYHPTNGLPLEQTYTEWKNGPYAAKNIPCQHCMMGEMRDTRAASQGPVRPVVFAHFFAGGNFALGNKNEAKKRLRSAATIDLKVDKSSAKPGDKLNINVKLTNSGAGHKIPTGLTEIRDMWLEIRGIDNTGKPTKIFEERFATVLEDAQGKHDGTVPVWRAVKIYSDNRIAPQEARAYTQTVTIPGGAAGVYKITASLNYRSATKEATDKLGLKQLPSIVMVSAQKNIALPGTETQSKRTSQNTVLWLVWAGIAILVAVVFFGLYALRRGGRSNA